MDLERIANFIKELRKEKNLTQEELADELHVHRTTVVKWESGSSLPLNDTLVMLSKYFNVSVDELLAGERITPETPIEVKNRVTLAILNDRRKGMRMAIYFMITTIILFISFLIYYFFTNYNSIHVYKLGGDTKNVITIDNLLIITNDKIYFKIGNIRNIINERLNFDSVILYYDNDYETKVLFSGDSDELLVEKRINIEIFNGKELKNEYDNMYLLVKYDDKEEIIKLKVVKDFENKSLLQLIFRNTNENYKDINYDIKLSDKFKYDEETDSYKLKDNNVEIECTEDIVCRIYFIDNNIVINYDYDKYANLLYCNKKLINQVFSTKSRIDLNKNLSSENKKIYQEFKEKILDKYFQ